jgi:hypothetical protein
VQEFRLIEICLDQLCRTINRPRSSALPRTRCARRRSGPIQRLTE